VAWNCNLGRERPFICLREDWSKIPVEEFHDYDSLLGWYGGYNSFDTISAIKRSFPSLLLKIFFAFFLCGQVIFFYNLAT
jgi:hypothetical protein